MPIVKTILALVKRCKRNDTDGAIETIDPSLPKLIIEGSTPPIIGEFVTSAEYSFLPYFRITNVTNLTLQNIQIVVDDFVSTKILMINALAPKQVYELGIEQGQVFYQGDNVKVELKQIDWIQTYRFIN